MASEVDDFYLQRDKVFLDHIGNGEISRTRRGTDEGRESEVEEVYGLDDEDENENEDDLEDYASSEGEEGDSNQRVVEVQRLAMLSDDDQEGEGENDEDDITGWGTSKSAYYGGNEEQVTTEQDALDEEAEARRIQKKQLTGMVVEDFMLGLDDWATSTSTSRKTIATIIRTATARTTTETLPTKIPTNLSPKECLALLHTRNPEFESLAAEFLELQRVYPGIYSQAEEGNKVAGIRYTVLGMYLGVLAMYFALLTREGGGQGVKEHGVMTELVRYRNLWGRVKGLQDEEQVVMNGVNVDVDMVNGVAGASTPKEEVSSVESRKEKQASQVVLTNPNTRKRVKLDLNAHPILNNPTPSSLTMNNSSIEQIQKKPHLAITDFSDLSALIPTSTSAATSANPRPTKSVKSVRSTNISISDFTEPRHLSTVDQSDKSRRKASLRFHAAQLLSKSALRATASLRASGDIDLPRKDPHPDRTSKAVERERNLGDDLDDLDNPTVEEATTKAVNAIDKDLEYYAALAATSRKARRTAKAVSDEFANFAEDMEHGKEGEADGKRAISYQIEKNKGLTPHRKKDVRNPRVKKRKAYEKAKKKLRTVKRVYEGGLKGAYGGEATGIKKNVVRSRKLR